MKRCNLSLNLPTYIDSQLFTINDERKQCKSFIIIVSIRRELYTSQMEDSVKLLDNTAMLKNNRNNNNNNNNK